MDRRTFTKTLGAGTLGALVSPFTVLGSMEPGEAGLRTAAPLRGAAATLPAARITQIRLYQGPNVMPLQIPLLQSSMVVPRSTPTSVSPVSARAERRISSAPTAARLIGRNPWEITRIWQDMYRSYHYPPGRERMHAMGALDLALWDLKGKALNVPVYEMLGGLTRNYLECYSTGGGGGGTTIQERAAECHGSGVQVLPDGRGELGNSTYDARARVNQVLSEIARPCAKAWARTVTSPSTSTRGSTTPTPSVAAR